MSTKLSVAELMGWERSHGAVPGATWRTPFGWVAGPPTPDQMLAWLRERTCPDCLIVSTECYQVWGPLVRVDCCCLRNGDDWPEIRAETIAGALELAVRAVAGATP